MGSRDPGEALTPIFQPPNSMAAKIFILEDTLGDFLLSVKIHVVHSCPHLSFMQVFFFLIANPHGQLQNWLMWHHGIWGKTQFYIPTLATSHLNPAARLFQPRHRGSLTYIPPTQA